MLVGLKSTTPLDVLLWSKPNVSLFTFFFLLFCWYFLFEEARNYLITISRIIYLLLILGLLHRMNFFDMSDEVVQRAFLLVCGCGWKCLKALHPLLIWEKPLSSFYLLTAALLLSQLGKWVTYENGALVILLLVFTVPVFYQKIRHILDPILVKFRKGANSQSEILNTTSRERKIEELKETKRNDLKTH